MERIDSVGDLEGGGSTLARSHLFISAVILIVLGMQASTFLTGTWIWPWMAYCMYAEPRYGHPSTNVTRIFATLDDGSEIEVTPQVTGLGSVAWKNNIRNKLFADKPKPILQSIAKIESVTEKQVEEVRLHITRYKLIEDERVSDVTIQHIDPDEQVVPGDG